MELAKDFYGGYSGLIEEAVKEFLEKPVVPYEDDIADTEKAKSESEWIDFSDLEKKINKD